MGKIRIDQLDAKAVLADADLFFVGDSEDLQNGLPILKKTTRAAITAENPKGKQGTITGDITGNTRGTNATDFQLVRDEVTKVASGDRSFIAGGQNNTVDYEDGFASGTGNTIDYLQVQDAYPFAAHAEGRDNTVHGWAGHAEGSNCYVDGKLSHAEGNTVICSTNDGHAEGNRTVAGRKYYPNATFGSEDAGDGLGVLPYVVIPNVEGNVSAYFPNALISSGYVTSNYGVGAQKDTKGNIYASGFTPAIWTGNVPTTLNDLRWALHIQFIVRGAGETQIALVTAAKAVYTGGSGTKIYYFESQPFDTIIGVYSSTSPAVDINGSRCSNGAHSEGIFTTAWGSGAHAEGQNTRAWAEAAHAEGDETTAINAYAHAEGTGTIASGIASHAGGDRSVASGNYSFSHGGVNTASGTYSAAFGQENVASGEGAVAIHRQNTASGQNSFATGRLNKSSGDGSQAHGLESVAPRAFQHSYSAGKRIVAGDDQSFKITESRSVGGVGWHDITLLDSCENNSQYHFEAMVIGVQYGGSAGAVGESFSYKVNGLFQKVGANILTLGTPTVALTGRSAGMTGDGITTGPRISYWGEYTATRCVLRFDGEADTDFRIQVLVNIQEIAL